jgi:hypothetical protein
MGGSPRSLGLSTPRTRRGFSGPVDVLVGSGYGTSLIATSTPRRGDQAGGSVTDHDDGEWDLPSAYQGEARDARELGTTERCRNPLIFRGYLLWRWSPVGRK